MVKARAPTQTGVERRPRFAPAQICVMVGWDENLRKMRPDALFPGSCLCQTGPRTGAQDGRSALVEQ